MPEKLVNFKDVGDLSSGHIASSYALTDYNTLPTELSAEAAAGGALQNTSTVSQAV